MRLLLEFGANPNLKDSIGNTPLHLGKKRNVHVSHLEFNPLYIILVHHRLEIYVVIDIGGRSMRYPKSDLHALMNIQYI